MRRAYVLVSGRVGCMHGHVLRDAHVLLFKQAAIDSFACLAAAVRERVSEASPESRRAGYWLNVALP